MTRAATTRALWALALVTLAGCAAQPLPGLSKLDSAKVFLQQEQYTDSLDLAQQVLEPDDGTQASEVERAEAAFVAAESALNLGEHGKAFKLYKQILESWPWSSHVGVIEDRLYEIGLAYFYDEQYGGWFSSRSRGVEVMETLQVHFSRSDRADDALRHVGDYFAEEGEWLEAALTYERVWNEYPDSEWAERSLWLAGHYRLRMIPGPQYNRDGLLKAEELLELSLTVHPRGVAAQDARLDLERVRNLLAESSVLVADFYHGRENPFGERLRLANVAILYPDTAAGRAARARLEAMGLDVEVLALDPQLNSVDQAQSAGTEWEGHQR